MNSPAIGHVFTARSAALGPGINVRRALPQKSLRMIGPWCFLDHFGEKAGTPGLSTHKMQVGQHPHIGLQTVTWLLEGKILHRDSLGSEQLIVPGQLNLMTAGSGITHSEESPPDYRGNTHGVQLWIALPERDRHMPPGFDHYPDLPLVEQAGMRIIVAIGEFASHVSPAEIHSPGTALDIEFYDSGKRSLPLKAEHEYGIIVTAGVIVIDGNTLQTGQLYFISGGLSALEILNEQPARVFLIGGSPFKEHILLWWNFVARKHEEIAIARQQWQEGIHFKPVPNSSLERMGAPILNYRLK